MAAGLESLRFQRRWSGIALWITWLVLSLVAGWGFHENTRLGFMILIPGFVLVAIQLMVRDHISRRMEQRRKPTVIRPDDSEAHRGSQQTVPSGK